MHCYGKMRTLLHMLSSLLSLVLSSGVCCCCCLCNSKACITEAARSCPELGHHFCEALQASCSTAAQLQLSLTLTFLCQDAANTHCIGNAFPADTLLQRQRPHHHPTAGPRQLQRTSSMCQIAAAARLSPTDC